MTNSNNSNNSNFVVGQSYVFPVRKGIAPKTGRFAGVLKSSENKFSAGSIEPGTEVTYLGRNVEGAQGLTMFSVPGVAGPVEIPRHHFDPGAKYYQGRKQQVTAVAVTPVDAAARRAALLEELAKLDSEEASLAALLALGEAAEAEATEEVEEAVIAEVAEEAAEADLEDLLAAVSAEG